MWQNLTRFGVLGLILALSACGTVQTLAPEKGKVKISYNDKKSYCQSIPRVYSGVAHNFCQLYGEPDRTSYGTAAQVPFWAIDTMVSAVADTLVLPYTATRQIKDGSIKVVR